MMMELSITAICTSALIRISDCRRCCRLHLPNTFLCENAKFDRLLALLVSVNAGASGSYSGFLGEKRTDDAYCLIDVQCLFAHRRDIVYRVFRITQGSAASDHLGGKIL